MRKNRKSRKLLLFLLSLKKKKLSQKLERWKQKRKRKLLSIRALLVMAVDGKILREFDINVPSVLTLTFAKSVKTQLLMHILSSKSELLSKLL